jgi:hypothetical protein
MTHADFVNVCSWWAMTINRCFLKRLWIALAAILGSTLTTARSNCEAAAAGVGASVADRGACACPGAFSDPIRVDEKGMGSNANRRMSSPAAQRCNEACDEHRACRSQPLAGVSCGTGSPDNYGRTGLAATHPRVHFLRSHGGSNLFRGGRRVATVTKQQMGDTDDDKASDDPNDDDDAYENLDVYDDSNAPVAASLPGQVTYLIAPEFAPKAWVAASPSTPFSTLKRLRC